MGFGRPAAVLFLEPEVPLCVLGVFAVSSKAGISAVRSICLRTSTQIAAGSSLTASYYRVSFWYGASLRQGARRLVVAGSPACGGRSDSMGWRQQPRHCSWVGRSGPNQEQRRSTSRAAPTNARGTPGVILQDGLECAARLPAVQARPAHSRRSRSGPCIPRATCLCDISPALPRLAGRSFRLRPAAGTRSSGIHSLIYRFVFPCLASH